MTDLVLATYDWVPDIPRGSVRAQREGQVSHFP